MKRIQQDQHHTAAQDFQQSLDLLEDILQEDSTETDITSKQNTSTTQEEKTSKNTETINLDALEDAVADIEQYLAQKTKNLSSDQA